MPLGMVPEKLVVIPRANIEGARGEGALMRYLQGSKDLGPGGSPLEAGV